MGSGGGGIRMSQRCRIAGRWSTSRYSGLTITLPGAYGTKVMSICIGSLHRFSSYGRAGRSPQGGGAAKGSGRGSRRCSELRTCFYSGYRLTSNPDHLPDSSGGQRSSPGFDVVYSISTRTIDAPKSCCTSPNRIWFRHFRHSPHIVLYRCSLR